MESCLELNEQELMWLVFMRHEFVGSFFFCMKMILMFIAYVPPYLLLKYIQRFKKKREDVFPKHSPIFHAHFFLTIFHKWSKQSKMCF